MNMSSIFRGSIIPLISCGGVGVGYPEEKPCIMGAYRAERKRPTQDPKVGLFCPFAAAAAVCV